MKFSSKKVCSLGIALLFAAAPSLTLAQAIEEILVTATKRERSIQDVNIATDAFATEELRDLGWTDVTQVASQSPNTDIKYAWGNSMPVYTIRGIGMNSFQASDTPSVGLFIDEIYQSSLVFMGATLFDMERVEVLKGPQTVLFGRNTNGGAVSYLSRKPSFDADGYIRADAGRFDRWELEGAFGGPLTETLAGRLSFLNIQQNEGYVFDRTSRQDIGEVDILAARAQLLWEPSDDFSVNFKLSASRDRSQPVYFQHVGFLTPEFVAGVPGAQRLCQSYIDTRNPDPNECVDTLGYSDTDGDPYAGEYTNRTDVPINPDTTLENDSLGGTITILKSFQKMDFTSLTDFQTYDRFQPKESDASPFLLVDLFFASDVQAFSQEFRFASTNDRRFNWIAGLVLSGDEVSEDPPRQLYFDDWLGIRAWLTYTQERESYAAYAQGEYQINDKWRLTVGGRLIHEELEFVEEVAFLLPPDFSVEDRLTVAVVPNPDLFVDGLLDSTEPTGRIALDYTPSDDWLLYGSIARGFKGGGFNAGLVTVARLAVPFEPEIVLAYELGFKSTLANNRVRLNGAVFLYDYEGLQAATGRFDEVIQSPLNFLTNLEAADVTGAELDLQWLVADGLEVKAGVGWLDTKNNDPGTNFDGVLGDAPRVLPNSPEWNFNTAVRYDLQLPNDSTLRFFTDYTWQDEHHKQIVNDLPVDAQGLWNARVSWISPDEQLSVSLWGKNLADEVYVMDTLGNAGGPAGWAVRVNGMPRTYGISARYKWGQ